jgi:hypothetical protein
MKPNDEAALGPLEAGSPTHNVTGAVRQPDASPESREESTQESIFLEERTYERIEDESPTLEIVDGSEVADALGAEGCPRCGSGQVRIITEIFDPSRRRWYCDACRNMWHPEPPTAWERTTGVDYARIQEMSEPTNSDTRQMSDPSSVQDAVIQEAQEHREADIALLARLRQPESDGDGYSASWRPNPLRVAAADRIEALRSLWLNAAAQLGAWQKRAYEAEATLTRLVADHAQIEQERKQKGDARMDTIGGGSTSRTATTHEPAGDAVQAACVGCDCDPDPSAEIHFDWCNRAIKDDRCG